VDWLKQALSSALTATPLMLLPASRPLQQIT